MQKIKKIALWIVGIVLALMLIASGIIYFKKDEIIRSFQDEFNKNLKGEFTYSSVGISFFSTFPQIGLSVYKPNLVSDVIHENDTLMTAQSIDLTFDLWEVFSGSETTTIREVMLDRPRARIAVTPDGKANYDIWIDSGDTTSTPADTAQAMTNAFRIDYFSVTEGLLDYRDSSLATALFLKGMDFETSGTLGSEHYNFEMFSTVDEASLTYEEIAYVDKASLEWNGDWDYHLDSSALTMKGHEILLNALKLEAGGKLVFLTDRYDMNINAASSGEDIRQILSLIPAVYASGIDRIETDGSFALNSTVNGQYGPDENDYPAFRLNGRIADGRFKYRDADSEVKQIQAELAIEKPQGDLNQTQVRIPDFSLKVDEYPLKGTLFVANMTNDPSLRGGLNTDLDLSSLKEALPPESFEQLSGQLAANVEFDFTYDQIERKDYENIEFSGNMKTKSLKLHLKPYPAIAAQSATLDISPALVRAQLDRFVYGQSDITGSLVFRDPLPFYFKNQPAFIEANLQGDRWVVDEWIPATDHSSPTDTVSVSQEETKPYPVNADVQLDIKQLDYTSYQLEDLVVNSSYSEDVLNIKRADTRWMGSQISMDGNLGNLQGYASGYETLKGRLNVRMDRLRIDDFIKDEESPDKDTEETKPENRAYVLPENIDILLDFSADAFSYGRINGEKLVAKANLEDRVLEVSNASMQGMGGRIDISGVYDTKEAERPLFDFKYGMSNMEIAELFGAVETFGLFVPIGERIIGRLNSELVLSGALDKTLSPIYDQLDASGNLVTMNAALPKLQVLNQVDEKLGFNALNNIELKDIKTWFNIDDGRLNVNEFPIRAGEVKMSMEGAQYLDKSMDYTIHAVVPKEMITSTQIGREADRGFDWLREQSKQAGIPIEEVNEIKFDIRLTGALDQPKLNISFAGADKETVKEKVSGKLDTVKSEVKDKVDTIKQEVRDQAKETLDTVRKNIKDKAKDIIDEQKKGGSDTTIQQTKDDLKKGAEETIDSVKDKLKKWNPFKKDKK